MSLWRIIQLLVICMVDKIFCPICEKTNDLNKFCIFCGHKLLGDSQTRLIKDNPEPVCLNCGKAVTEGQMKCECGFELADITCPGCGTKNSYSNRFCTVCGKKLWSFHVFDYKYSEKLFEHHVFSERLPSELIHTSLKHRFRKGIGKSPELWLGVGAVTVEDFKLRSRNVDGNLREICSRWKVVSPDYCINCLYIIESDEYTCAKCASAFIADRKRVESLQFQNSYTEPEFKDAEAKWIPKCSDKYFGSLAPAPGESQLEYRERLKWEYAENHHVKKRIKEMTDSLKQSESFKNRQVTVKGDDGWYCNYSCKYYIEYFEGDQMDVGHDYSYCALGRDEIFSRNFCSHYEE